MQKPVLLIPLCALTLLGCSPSPEPSASSSLDITTEPPTDYMALYKDATDASKKEDIVRLSCVDVPTREFFQGQIGMALYSEDDPTPSNIVALFNNFSFDARFSGLQDKSKTPDSSLQIRGGKLNINTNMEDIPSSLGDLRFNLGGIASYSKEGMGYLNVSNAALIKTAVEYLAKEAMGDDYEVPSSGKWKWAGESETTFDWDASSLVTSIYDATKKAYEKEPDSFSFSTGASYSITFSTTDKAVVKDLLLSEKEGAFLNESRLDAYLNHCNLKKLKTTINFAANRLLSSSIDLQIEQVDTVAIHQDLPEDRLVPYSDIILKGTCYFDFGEEHAPDFPDDLASYEDLPPIDWDKVLPKEDSSETASE